jgi:hypothetical protein
MFKLAAAGCGGVNMETGVNQLGFISSYSPIGDEEHGHYVAAPEFYGMLAFAQGTDGVLIDSQLRAGNSNLDGYAVLRREKQLCITLINKEPNLDVSVAIEPTLPFQNGTVLRLSAPSLESDSGVTLGGASVKPDGTWRPEEQEKIRASDGRIFLRLPAASAAVLIVKP